MNVDLPSPSVLSLHRYPVKSILRLHVTGLVLDHRGVVGDRLWSVRTASGKIGSGKNTRRFATVAGLLDLQAQERDGHVLVALPDGSAVRADATDAAARLSDYLGQSVTLALETDVSHFDDGPVSLVGSASLAAVARERGAYVDSARFRSNIVLRTDEPFVEEQWIGRHVQLSTAVLVVTLASPRCVMVDAATAKLPAQPGNLTAIGRINHARLGIVATVVEPGAITTTDSLTVQTRLG